MVLSKTPTSQCVELLAIELKSLQNEEIWFSRWPVMQRMIDRAEEWTSQTLLDTY